MAEPSSIRFHNRLKDVRVASRLSQGDLASKAGITRQAVSAIESELYLPTTAVALRLAAVLSCRVEDLFSLAASEEVVEGRYIGGQDKSPTVPLRVKVTKVGKNIIVRRSEERRVGKECRSGWARYQ